MSEKRDPVAHLVVATQRHKHAVNRARLCWEVHELDRLGAWKRVDADPPPLRMYELAAANVDRTREAMVAAIDAAWHRIRESGVDPDTVYRLADLSDYIALSNEWERVRPMLRAVRSGGASEPPATEGDPASGAGGPKDEPTDMERDTYYVYRAVEAMLMAEHDASSVTQRDVHAAAPALLRDRIDREAIGVSGGYKVQPTFGAFRKAFKRADAKLSARRG